ANLDFQLVALSDGVDRMFLVAHLGARAGGGLQLGITQLIGWCRWVGFGWRGGGASAGLRAFLRWGRVRTRARRRALLRRRGARARPYAACFVGRRRGRSARARRCLLLNRRGSTCACAHRGSNGPSTHEASAEATTSLHRALLEIRDRPQPG